MTKTGKTPLILAVICLIAAVFFWRLGDVRARDMVYAAGLSTARLTQPLTAGDYDAMARAESDAASPLPFALWSELGGETAEAPDFGRSAAVAVLAARGASRLALPGSAALDADDTLGCLIDRGTARALFGGENAAGSILRWRGRNYEVRGTVELPAPGVLLNLPEDSEMPLGLLTVASGDAAEFLARHGLGAGLVVRGVFFTRLAAVLGGLPICMAAAILFAALARLARRWRGYPLRGLVLLIACWALAAALLLGLIGAVPPELLPGRWSDFPAWGALFRGWVTGLFELFASAKTRPELRMTAESLRAAWGAVSAALLFAGGRLLLHARSITS